MSLGKLFGVNYGTIQRHLKKLGIPLKGRHHTPEGRARLSDARRIHFDDEALRHWHDQQLSTREMAQLAGCSPEAVRRRMVQLGLPRLAPKSRMTHNHFWAGGLSVDKYGYILEKTPGHPYATKTGYVRQHRLVMGRHLGRFVRPGEVVDHVNGDPSDNRIENLRLFASNGEHLRHTRTGKAKLPRQERECFRQEAVRRAHQRVAAILAASETGAGR